jgi:Flp pilus assembly protein TadG
MGRFLQVIASRFGHLRSDRRGVGAIEFAFIAPVLILLYIGALEVSVAMSVNKKLARASSTVADLVTQAETINKAGLVDMVAVARSVMAPYNSEGLGVRVSAITIGPDKVARIDWSWEANGATGTRPYVEDSVTDVPANLLIENTSLLRSELTFEHEMITSFPITGQTMTSIDMGKTYHLRARLGDSVDCSNC